MTPPKSAAPLETLEGVVERIVFSNPETSYIVATVKLVTEGKAEKKETTIVGALGGVVPQETLKMVGSWIADKKYGRQFKVETFESMRPSTAQAMEKYLASGLIKGIGKSYAGKLVSHFGTDIFEIIENNPERLFEVAGIGRKRIEQIKVGWDEHRILREIAMFLKQHSIPMAFANRIYKIYGEKAVDEIKRNPYQLALEVRGIGFKTADTMAQQMGIPVESLERCKAGVFFLLTDMAGDGHVFVPADPLISKATETLGVPGDLVVAALNALKADQRVVLEILPDSTRAAYLAHLHRHEVSVAENICRLMNSGKLFPKIDAAASLKEFEARHNFNLAENQRLAVTDALKGGVLVITGGPGTGKTTIIRTILRILEVYGVSVILAAPTGRAAKRMQELTRVPASTLHRLLQYSPQESKYLRNPQNPIKADFVIVDEASMVDTALANATLRAISGTTSLIVVGDVDQLPSVGPGNFLLDLIRSGSVPVVRLNEVFRQAQTSMIITNAHRINQGNLPSLQSPGEPGEEGKRDFYFFPAETPEDALRTVRDLVHHRITSRFGFDPKTDIQVLAPMHRGLIGAQNLNREIQEVLNPGNSAQLERGGTVFRVHDKVMQTSNDYDKDVFNGDIGTIVSINREEHLVKVTYDGRIVGYDFNEMDSLELAYCITVHKSQGSEYKAIILPVHSTHYVMLQRNLLYTAVTRGKKLVCLVGQRKAVQMAVNNVSADPRFSALHLRLKVMRECHPSPLGF